MRLKSLLGLLGCLVACTTARVARATETTLELSVETGSPDALCPDLAATRRAVRDRIGQLSLESDKRWVARYTIGHAPATGGDYVQLSLTDGAGNVRLERRLPLSGESCETVVQAIALVLERYFRELQAPQSEPEADTEPEVAAPASAAAPRTEPPAEATELAPRLAPRAPAPRPAPHLAPSLQLAAKAGFAVGPNTGVVGLELGYWFPHWLQASLEPQLLVPQVVETVHDDQGNNRGSAQLLEVPLRATFGLGYRQSRWALRVGPAARVSLRRADTHGIVTHDETPSSGDSAATGWCVALGGAVGISWWVSQTFGLSASAALDEKLGETRFLVDSQGGSQTLLSSPATTFQALVGVAFGATP